ncbi:MAG: imidazoleglycerol-phosphate dehydratase HisB [Nitrospinota bacterium]|nr:imidazoleglycerol-phosphate dehydratase HisB [Nitrospinota bacterium]
MARAAKIARKTRETEITVEVNLDGSGKGSATTGVPFFDHMLDHLRVHSMIDMTVNAKGDVEVDGHHTVEDVGICLGKALAESLAEKKGITRYGAASIPMNETLAEVSLDVSGRPFVVFQAPKLAGKVGEFDVELAEEFIRALANSGGLTIHVNVRAGTNMHHIVEAIFKALARALGQAVCPDPRLGGAVPSTKEVL